MNIRFVAGFSPITPDIDASSRLYREVLKLPLESEQGYLSTGDLDGVKHFGVWTLSAAAQSCFGKDHWPDHVPVPQATLEFELGSPQEVTQAMDELERAGYALIHSPREEPWGQTVGRLMSPEGLLLGLSFAPWLHSASQEG